MNFQTRIFVAVALCATIFIVFDFLNPRPPLEETETDAAAQVDESKDGESKDGKSKGDDAKTSGEASAPSEPAAAPTGPKIETEEHELRNDLLALTVTNRSPGRGGAVSAVHLLSPQFEGHDTATDSLGLEGKRTLEISLSDDDGNLLVPRGAAYEVRETADDHITLAYVGEQIEVVQTLTLLEGYEAKVQVDVHNRGTDSLAERVHVRTRIGDSDSRYDIRRGICRTSDDIEDEDKSDVEDGPIRYGGGIDWAGVDGKYFTMLVVPSERAQDCEISQTDDELGVEGRVSTAAETVEPGRASTHVFGLYIGPKELERLKTFSAVDASIELEEAIDWGFFGGLSEWLGKLLLGLLRWFHGLVANWGWSIVLLTVVVKGATLPLTLKQMSSMKRMKEIQPEMAKIKEKYADDRAKQGQEMQALFSRSGVNPLAGCFPMLVQLPIWFALYSMLGAAVELVHEPFLWLPDLTEQDPFYILPLALGALMILQQQMMPSTMDAAQAKLMRWVMPIMFTVFMLFLPSGLGVYIFANIVLSLIQTMIQMRTKTETQEAAT
ncbi:MAG: membrane protein insertase YidC [Myxococcota bacterium]